MSFDAANWLQQAGTARQFDLSQPIRKGMPIHPVHPPFHITLNNRHGDMVRACGHSSSNEMMVTSTHSATHIDALCHVSDHGKLHGGADAEEMQRGVALFKENGAETIGPIMRRGVLLDVAKLHGGPLKPVHEITPAELEACGVEPEPGDVVLIRTGWGQFWDQAPRFLGLDSEGAPGPGVAAGHWLAERKPFAVGSDTSAFEVMNHHNITLEVHMILIAQNGIHIIENLLLEDLAAAGCTRFAFLALPLPIVGATGAPIRPLALG